MRVILADDSALIRDGLARLLSDEGIEVLDSFSDTVGLVEAVCDRAPDVLIVDIRMPPTFTTEGLEAALEVRRRAPETGVLVLSQHIETTYAIDLLADNAGGVGYLLKDRVTVIDEFLDALRRVARRRQCHRSRSGQPVAPPITADPTPRPAHRTRT